MKKRKIALTIILLIIVIRIALPSIVKYYVNHSLSQLEDYSGRVEDIDLAIYRGAYTIKGLTVNKRNGEIEEPFVYLPQTDLSVQWKALFEGSLVSEVVCAKPEINFAFSESDSSSQTGVEEDWTAVLTDLMPIAINRFQVIDGQVSLINALNEPKTNLSFSSFNGELTNVRNVYDLGDKLPSTLKVTADLEGIGGKLTFDSRMFLLKAIPDFEYDLKLLEMNAVEINPMSEYFANINFEKGSISILSEMALNDGKLKGYLKPIGNDIKVFKFNEEKDRDIGRFFTELLVEVGKLPLTNFKKDQVAAKIPLSGTIENTDTSVWPILFSSLRNAYVQAFEKQIEDKEFFREL